MYKKRLDVNLEGAHALKNRLAYVRSNGAATGGADVAEKTPENKYVQRHRKKGKLLARERVEKVLDPGTRFLELSALAAWDRYDGNKSFSASVARLRRWPRTRSGGKESPARDLVHGREVGEDHVSTQEIGSNFST